MKINNSITVQSIQPQVNYVFELAGQKIQSLSKTWDPSYGAPVYTVNGRYSTRGWTEWTNGFKNGLAILQFDATNDEEFLRLGKRNTFEHMTAHLSDTGVHDHGFNNVSTYGNLRRLMLENRIPFQQAELAYCELALKLSGAVQACRWTHLNDEMGYIYSFNGPHSLFVDTIRSLRVLGLSHSLGHTLLGENGQRISLLDRLLKHSRTTAKYNVYYGKDRDTYDTTPGRTAHESIFNIKNGQYRCPSTQQGYSPFSTWTRGLAWAMCGYAELLEFSTVLPGGAWEPFGVREAAVSHMLEAAVATSEFYISHTALDGIPYWDTGAPGLKNIEDYTQMPSDPWNNFEPVDSSAAAIAAQGLIRLGRYLTKSGNDAGHRYVQAGLTVASSLFSSIYLSEDDNHQGLILHSIYHRPNGWDYIPGGRKVPCGESSMWGDYHAAELALLIKKMAAAEYFTFFAQAPVQSGYTGAI